MKVMKLCTALVGIGLSTIAGVTWLGLPLAAAGPARSSRSVKPPVSGNPGGRVPGGSRNPTCLGQQSLKVLMPTAGTTTAKHPTFQFLVPSSSAKVAEFVLQDETRKQVYKTSVNLNNRGGVTSLSLPSSTKGLDLGKRYRWFFSVVCDTTAVDQSSKPFLQGEILRVSR